MSTPIPTPSTDMKITLAGTYTFPRSYTFPELAAITAERDQLRAELATERARLDWFHEAAGDSIWVASQDIRAAIDAAMQEEAK